MNLLYKIIYHPAINKVIRNTCLLFKNILPSSLKINPAGTLVIPIDGTKARFVLKTNQTSYISRELFWDGAMNFEYTPVFVGLIQKVAVFLDIGANIGYYSILGSTVNSHLTTYAFEPALGARTYLDENVKINHFSNRIFVESYALMDHPGEIDFFEIRNKKYPAIYNLSGEHNIGTKTYKLSNKIRVEATTLDAYFSNHDINALDIIKLDTEGAEGLILKGAKTVIERYQPIIICEVLFDRIEKELEKIMRQHEYVFYAHTDEGLRLIDTLIREKDDGVRNVFFTPKSKQQLLEEWIIE
ncbi:FkbM family methyltransferase [Kordia periserrulae]|uniref:FkbM family methyltransferase n=1 Tax=Kordia periserrulae TaxID=701523 RepID=A0A2T6BXW1_9FLAO|nr:FkbM family methyltransferase [Kordia periserrulae]PTX60905.1 FkbM family methyltransferase [Kordia periserrulae]